MDNYVIITLLILILVIIYFSQKSLKEGFAYPVGFCNEVYSPNKKNFIGGTTDCGKEDGVFKDWEDNGGKCPPGFINDRREYCGSGCRVLRKDNLGNDEPAGCAAPWFFSQDREYSIVDYSK